MSTSVVWQIKAFFSPGPAGSAEEKRQLAARIQASRAFVKA
jgi:hypothetical protein